MERSTSSEKESSLCLFITVRGAKEDLSDQKLANPPLHREPFDATETAMSAHGKASIEQKPSLTPGSLSREERDEE